MISKSDYDVTEAIRFFNKYSVEVTFLVPTAVGLGKAIMDATATLRAYLKQKGIHNYDGQLQGPDGKKTVEAFFVTDSDLVPATASLYRPVAKGKSGDPRIWFSKLTSYANPNNLIAIIADQNKIYVVNVSRAEILKSAATVNSPFYKILNQLSKSSSEVAEELLDKLRAIASKGWIKTVTAGDTGIGATLEHYLGIRTNSSQKPDYKGIELKAKRVNRFGGGGTRSSLFAQVPDWSLSKLKSSAEILDAYGYFRGAEKKLYCTVRSDIANPQSLLLKVLDTKDELHECSLVNDKLDDVAIWKFDVLRDRLLTKHNETFWIAGSSSVIAGDEHFKYDRVKHTRSPFATNFHTLCQEGIITLDHLIKRDADGNVKEKGPLFKIKPNDLNLLFPPPLEYSLR
jgi:hypothetical protein